MLLIAFYFPITSYSLFAILKAKLERQRDNDFLDMRPNGRRIAIEIVTNGQNPEVVEDIISRIKNYKISCELWVLKEEYDKFTYSANEIIVPADYKTPNNSFRKMRALHYGIEYFHNIGYGPETYIVHLDDDSIINKSYLRYVERMRAHAGQGSIRLRGYGEHLLSTLADMIRVSDCDIYCKNFNRHSHPKLIHGEGLVIRADVEYEIGWDYAGYGAEDLIMGINIPERGYSFCYIPDYIYISPPTSVKDFYKQRRRWTYSIMSNRKLISRINRKSMAFIVYRYAVGWTGLVGMTLWFIDLIMGQRFPIEVTLFGGFNLVMSLMIYEYGVWQTQRKYVPLMALMLIPIAFYEGGTFVYTLLKPPRRDTFDVIRKVRL